MQFSADTALPVSGLITEVTIYSFTSSEILKPSKYFLSRPEETER